MKPYLWNVLVAFDQLFNALLAGDPDMTISGRMGRAVAEGRCMACRAVCWLLDRVDAGHCARANANEADEGRA
ncbi:hypothetical protein [Variovorax sp. GT1P44]|uniref:hypothetical protein n=1 Tax=Variovorax sp. GT1P44 TaxID=3443742 RepID=UPI003F490091